MADPPAYPDSSDDTGEGPGRESVPGAPRWVKVFAIIGLVVVLLIAGLIVFGGGGHGPGRHLGGQTPSGHTLGRTPASSGAEAPASFGRDLLGHAPPGGGRR